MNQADHFRVVQEERCIAPYEKLTAVFVRYWDLVIFQDAYRQSYAFYGLWERMYVCTFEFIHAVIGLLCLDRVGSEFWNQQVRIGNDLTGIKWVAFEILFGDKDVLENWL